MDTNLTKSAAIGIMWSGITQFSLQVFRFVVIIILARLLNPEDFGIVGLAALFIGIINIINDLGLSAAIIQRKDLEKAHLSTSFWASVGIAILLWFFSILISPFVADFFQEGLVRPILIVTSAGLVIGSFCVVHKALLQKKLKFKKIAIAEISGAFVSGIASIFLAFNQFGVWSLVYGQLLANFVMVLIFWRLCSWKPGFNFSYRHFKDLFTFGGNVMGSRLLNYIDSNVDYLVVGKLLGKTSLGYYTIAYQLMTFPLHKISMMVTRVTFPIFSTIQDDNDALRRGYTKTVRYISLITFPLLTGMLAVAPEFIIVVFGEKWAPIILPLQILCLAGALKSIGTTVGSVLLAKGRSDLQFKWNIITVIVVPIAVVIGAKNYGITGVASAITVMTILLFPIIQTITNRLIDLSMYEYMKAIYPSIIGSLVLLAGVEIFQKSVAIYNISDIIMLGSSILIGFIVYLLILWLFFNNLFKELNLLIYKIKM